MDFAFTQEQEDFRKEVRGFLEEEIKHKSFTPRCDGWIIGYSPEFSRKLAQRGWLGLTWPKEHGGQQRSNIDRLVLTEELLRYGAPTAAHWMGDRQMGPSIIAYGSDALKREFLPRIVKAEIFFGLGMSEPEAGSDLASLKTCAVEKEDYFVIDGQKVWTSGAHVCTHCYLIARTDPDAPKHKGLSEFILDMKTPGITVNPVLDLTGDHHYNEVFFDGVKVPKKYLLGEKNRGWYQITPQLDYERSGIERLMTNYPLFSSLLEYVKETKRNGNPLSKDPLIRNKLAQFRIEFEAGRMLVYRVACLLDKKKVPNYETAMAKAYCTDFEQRLARAAVEILGPYGLLRADSKWASLNGHAADSYLFNPGYTLQGGTTEVLKTIIAQRGLGLPRG